jgi:hypothetical protein
VNPAVIEWGGPVLKLLWAFMHSRRLVMRCPSSSYDILLDEALSDIGNCCSQTEWGGFGSSKADHMLYTRRINDRLNGLPLPTGVVDPGVFMPVNSDQSYDTVAQALRLEPNRLFPDFANYGRSLSMPTVEQWYRLPCPIPFPAIPQPKLKISLVKANGDDPYVTRTLEEGGLANISPALETDGKFFPLQETGIAPDLGYPNEVRIPGGQMRIGIGLKGFEVRGAVCDQLMEMYEGRTFPEMKEAVDNMLATRVMSGPVKLGCSGPVGRPEE